jgi:hypothetical protein
MDSIIHQIDLIFYTTICQTGTSFRSERMPFEEHHQLQFAEDDGVDAGSPTFGVVLSRPVAHKAQVQRCFEMAVEVVLGEKILQRDGNRLVEAAGFGRAEHDDGLLAAGADGDGE